MNINDYNGKGKALFLSPSGNIYPDYLVCSGELTGDHPCPYSNNGRIPTPEPLKAADLSNNSDKGEVGDLCPPCVKQQLGNLGHWEGHRGNKYPEELKELRLFKCSQWLWLVIPGLFHSKPNLLELDE